MAVLAGLGEELSASITHTIARMERSGLVERRSCASGRPGRLRHPHRQGLSDPARRPARYHVASVRDALIDIVDDDLLAIGRAFSSVVDDLGRAHDGTGNGP